MGSQLRGVLRMRALRQRTHHHDNEAAHLEGTELPSAPLPSLSAPAFGPLTAAWGSLGWACVPPGVGLAFAMGASGLSRRRAVTLLGLLLLAVGATLVITGRHKKAPLQTYWCDCS